MVVVFLGVTPTNRAKWSNYISAQLRIAEEVREYATHFAKARKKPI